MLFIASPHHQPLANHDALLLAFIQAKCCSSFFPYHHTSKSMAMHDALLKPDSFELHGLINHELLNPKTNVFTIVATTHKLILITYSISYPQEWAKAQFLTIICSHSWILGIPKLKCFKWFTNKINRNTTKSQGLLIFTLCLDLEHHAIWAWTAQNQILNHGFWDATAQAVSTLVRIPAARCWVFMQDTAGKPVQRQSVITLIFFWVVTTKKGWYTASVFILLFVGWDLHQKIVTFNQYLNIFIFGEFQKWEYSKLDSGRTGFLFGHGSFWVSPI